MIVNDIINKFNLKLHCGEEGLKNTVDGCYICDLLSLVMSNAKKGNIWITVQTNINVVAVAVLTEVACVILPEDIKPDDITVKKANIEGIPILSSQHTAYELAVLFSEIL